jgi:NAD(P) transhydrogenase
VVSDRGIITVNRDYQTNLSHIYAAGDVIGPPALAASSSEQGRLAARHAFGLQSEPFSELFPYGIYTIPEISSVGAQESELQKAQKPYVVGRARYSELARGQILGDEHGLLKILVSREDGRVLGVHILGTGATELIHIGQTAMHFQAKVDFFVSNIFNYPTLAEAYKVAALNALNQL